jgi:hypothetical protein
MAEFPRPLTEREREVLQFLLSAQRPGVAELRHQAGTATVVGTCSAEGCPCVEFAVDQSAAAPAGVPTGHYIGAVTEPADPGETVWVDLWTANGWLEGIELSWIDFVPPEFPGAEDLDLIDSGP